MTWPDRQEKPPGCLRLVGLHQYETLYEYLHRLMGTSRGWVTGWKLECWKLVTVGPMLAKLEPAIVHIERHGKFQTSAWYKGTMPPPAPGAGNNWDALVDDVAREAAPLAGPSAIGDGTTDDVDVGIEVLADESAEEDGWASAADDWVSEAGSFLLADDLREAGFSSDDDIEVFPPETVPSADGAAPSATGPVVAAAEASPVPVGVEGAAAPADAFGADVPPVPAPVAGARVSAYKAAQVKHGVVRAYVDKTMRMVASCSVHGERDCRLSRSLLPSDVKSRSGQGRPLGLMVAWLACAEEYPDARAHKDMKPMPSFADRQQARADFFADADHDRSEWIDGVERGVRAGEGEEPERVP